MKIKMRGEEWLLGWKHEINSDKTGKTTCYMKNKGGLVVETHACCVSPDIYNKKTGRKLSLQRLTNKMGMKKEEKRFVWDKVKQEICL